MEAQHCRIGEGQELREDHAGDTARRIEPANDHFEVVGYDIHEGLSVDELIDQNYTSDIDLLMVDYNMVESGKIYFNGDEVLRKYELIKPHFPMIIFTNYDEQAFPKVDNPNTLYQKELAIQKLDKFVQILEAEILMRQQAERKV